MQASTWLHESGHNGNLRHGGINPAEANCKPNYQSVMNYLFQTRGVICDASATLAPACVAGMAGQPVIDLSRQVLPCAQRACGDRDAGSRYRAVSDGLPDAVVFPGQCHRRRRRHDPPTKRCDGGPILGEIVSALPDQRHFGLDGDNRMVCDRGAEWHLRAGRLVQHRPHHAQRLQRLGEPLTTLNGSSDWATIDLRHVGSRRNVGGLSIGVTVNDLNDGDDLGKGDLGKGDLGKGDLGKGGLGKGDLGKGDLGKGDLGDGPPDSPRGNLDLDTARHVGDAPNQLIPVVFSKFIPGQLDTAACRQERDPPL